MASTGPGRAAVVGQGTIPGPEWPAVQELEGEIAELEEQLAQAKRQVQRGSAVRFRTSRNLLTGSLLATVAWGLADRGAVETWSLYRLFLIALAPALVAVWSLPVRARPRTAAAPIARLPFSVFVLAGVGLFLGVRAVAEPPLTGQGFILAILGWLVLCLTRWLVGSDRGLSRTLSAGLVAFGVLEACYGLFQAATATEGGLLPAKVAGTLFNPNHFAGLLNMTLALALGGIYAGLRHPGPRFRALWLWLSGAGAVLMAAAVVLSRSRGGVMALVTMLLFAVLLIRMRDAQVSPLPPRRAGVSRARSWGWAVGPVLLAVMLAAGVERTFSRPDVADVVRRLLIYGDTMEMIADHPWTGVGAGMYRWHFRPYQQFDTRKRFDHAHNDFLEVAAEWGVPVAIAVFLFFLWRLGRSMHCFMGADDPRRRGLGLGTAGAILSLLVHGLVDFHLPIPSTWMVFAMVLGLSWSPDDRETLQPSAVVRLKPAGTLQRHSYVIRILLSLLLVGTGWAVGRQVAAMAAASTALERGDLERARRIGPAWPALYFRIGVLHRDDPSHRHPRSAKQALERAVELNPYSWRFRYELARLYESAGRIGKAEETYRQALALNPRSADYRHRVGGFYLRRGDRRQALVLLRQAVAGNPALLTESGNLLSAFGMSTAEIAGWWPREPTALGELVQWLILRRLPDPDEVRTELLRDAWRRWSDSRPPPTIHQAGFYLRHLLDMGSFAEARRQWVALAGVNGLDDRDFASRRNEVWNGSFEMPLSGGALAWQTPSAGGTTAAREEHEDGAGYSLGKHSLRIDFDGAADARRVRQQVVVDGGGTWELSFSARCVDLRAPAGVALQVLDGDGSVSPLTPRRAGSRVLFTSEAIAGTSGWRQVAGSFEMPAGGRIVKVRLGLPRAADGTRVIRGTLWLDEVVLRPVCLTASTAEGCRRPTAVVVNR